MSLLRLFKKPKFIIFAILVLIAASIVAVNVYDTIQDELILDDQKIMKMPDSYTKEADRAGYVETIRYTTDFKGQIVNKKANVYIPYGYDESRRYNVFYLMHGRGGTYKSWLGAKGKRQFKNVLDHMIEDKIIKPLIVVTPGLAYEYGKDDDVMNGTAHEIAKSLVPVIDSQYSTYGNRNHRCMGGFSMGGSLTWHMLKDHTNLFRYYIPMSMAYYYDRNGYAALKSQEAATSIIESLETSGYTSRDFKVYVATGSDDFKGDAAYMQMFDLTENNNIFKYTDYSYKKGNIMFKIWPHRWHRFTQSFPYIYNALCQFFPRS